MNQNPYQAPQADLSVPEEKAQHQFYVVSGFKFVTLYVVTLGMYILFWFYQNWKLHKAYNNTNVWPVPRAIFSIFFVHSLLERVQETLDAQGNTKSWSPAILASLYIIFTVISHIADGMASNDMASPTSDLVSFAMLPLICLVLFKAQKMINLSQGDPAGLSNSNFTAANYFWIVVGAAFWTVLILGLMAIFGVIEV